MESTESDNNLPQDTVNIKKSPILKLLKKKERKLSHLKKLNLLLKDKQIDLNINDPILDGSYLHYLTQTAKTNDDVSWRMVYAFSNAGLDVNIKNSKGNTCLHLAFQRGYTEIGFLFIEALLKVGIDLEIRNNMNKTAYNYMENITQLKAMTEAHSPSIWLCVQEGLIDDVHRLMNAWIKPNKKLLSLAHDNNQMINILKSYSLSNSFVHALCAIDIDLMKDLVEDKQFDANIAEYCYIFSWYKPVFRNLPKFLLELAFETKQDDIILLVLSFGANVNFFDSTNGNPFYFLAFEAEFRRFKQEILSNSNFNIKNHRGQNILFHILNLYLNSENREYNQELLKDFNLILNRNPILLTQRDETDLSLFETILFLPPTLYSKASEFIILISKFILELLKIQDLDALNEMIFDGYGLVLMNTPLFISNPDDSNSNSKILLKEYISSHHMVNGKTLNNFFDTFIDFYVNSLVIDFFKAVKMGDILNLKAIIDLDKKNMLTKFKDFSGRSCLHLSILYNRPAVFKFLLQMDSTLIYEVDNLNRTCLHYAIAIKEQKIIDVLKTMKIDTSIRDSKYLVAYEYENEEVLNDNWFCVRNFRENEMRRVNGACSNVICFEYLNIKKAIESNDIKELDIINLNMKNSFFSFKDIVMWKSEKSYIEGKAFIPPLEQAMMDKCFLSFQYLLENGVEPQKNLLPLNVRNLKSAKERRIMSARNKTPSNAHNRIKSGIRHVDMSLEKLREKAEILEIFEIIDILDNFGENAEIIAAANARNDLLSAKRYKTVSVTSESTLNEGKSSIRKKNVSIISNKSTKSNLSNICLIL